MLTQIQQLMNRRPSAESRAAALGLNPDEWRDVKLYEGPGCWFTAAKITHLNLLPQGQPERHERDRPHEPRFSERELEAEACINVTPASRLMHNHVNAPNGEFMFDVTSQKPLRFLFLPQCGIHVAKRESTHEQVSLFP